MNRKRFLELASDFRKKSVLVFGDMMLDEWIWGYVSRISPEAPVPVVQVEKQTYSPGGASNVAANISRLGAKAFVMGLIGSDEEGKILKRELTKHGIDTQGLCVAKGRPTTLKTRIVAHSQQVVRTDVESRIPVDGLFAGKIENFFNVKISASDAVLFSDYNKGCVSPSIVPKLVKQGLSKKKIIVAGAKPSNLNFFKGIALIVLNESEAAQVLGSEIKTERDLNKAGLELLRRFNVNAVLITRGASGMTLFQKAANALTIPSRASQVYDVSGAGDTVVAVVTLALACGSNLEEAAILANNAAGIVVRKIGTATVTLKELEETF